MTLELGRAYRLPSEPPASKIAPPLAAKPYTVGGNRTRKDVHGVVDRHRGSDASTRRVDVEVNFFAFVFTLQVQQLHHQLVGVAVINLALQKHDAVLQQQITQRHLTLTLIVLVRVRGFWKVKAMANS